VIVLGFYDSSVDTVLILLYCSYMNEFFKYLKEIKLIYDLTKKFRLVPEYFFCLFNIADLLLFLELNIFIGIKCCGLFLFFEMLIYIF